MNSSEMDEYEMLMDLDEIISVWTELMMMMMMMVL
jgi:hypothetical protein